MKRPSTEVLKNAADDLLKELIAAGADLGGPDEAVLRQQFDICVDQLSQQTDFQWSLVPEDASVQQVIIMMYLINIDLHNGTNYVDRALGLAKENEANAAADPFGMLSFDDVVGGKFQA